DWKPMEQSGMPMLEKSLSSTYATWVIPDVDLNNDDDDSRKKGGKKDEYPLEVDSYGLPVIPDVKGLTLRVKSVLSGCSSQNTTIQLADADRLLELWCQRQKGHVRPTFEFKGWEGDDKTMRESAEVISGNGSDTRPKDPVKKSTRKRTGRVEQVSSSEDEDKDDEDEEKDDNNNDNEEKDDDDDDEKDDDDDDDGTSPPPKLTPATNHIPVKKSRPVNMRSRASPAPSAAEHEDPHPLVNKSVPVPLPPKLKLTKKCSRVDHIQSDLESDSRPPRKKSQPNNASTGSAQSTGAHDNDPPPSNSRAFGPTSGIHAKKKNHKTPVPKPTPACPKDHRQESPRT
ncbi:hypothetical protein DFJ58DRAFT_850059, partial [Suillus subalutaceus]|uniref:uncharacterized protein n=1 Tax=Suillus subalutaceus TaxID=48586 RepID=UPI001B85EC38